MKLKNDKRKKTGKTKFLIFELSKVKSKFVISKTYDS